MAEYLANDMEFYHDKGGVTLGVEGMKQSMQKNIYGDTDNKVRREPVPGTFKLFLLKNGDLIYGAIISVTTIFIIRKREERKAEMAWRNLPTFGS